jgi:hypothetical protein
VANRKGGAPLPPLTPRDWQITLGQKLLRVLPWKNLMKFVQTILIKLLTRTRTLGCRLYFKQASASCIVRVGRDVFFDNSQTYLTSRSNTLDCGQCLGPEYRIHEAITDGHGDAVFAILKPGVILIQQARC